MPPLLRNAYENMILLCPTHHALIDKAAGVHFSVDALRKMKHDHEKMIAVRESHLSNDRKIAQNVITYLADRRVLFRAIYAESQPHCVESANRIREFLTKQLCEPDVGKELRNALVAIRAACRTFVDAADADGTFNRKEWEHTDPFSLALGALRASVGVHLARLAERFDLEVEPQLAEIVPPELSAEDGQVLLRNVV
nr:DUF6650 family protein [Catelliglobosispora koreensis]